MTYRLPMLAAILLLAATGAQAGNFPISTDEARALAGRSLPVVESGPAPAFAGAPKSTDEARALAGRSLPVAESSPAPAFAGAPRSTDEARALAASGLLAANRSGKQETKVACSHQSCSMAACNHESCACKHG